MKIGILCLQGDVIEHFNALKQAIVNLKINCEINEVRTKNDLENLDGLIIPGGESTTLMKLLEREEMIEEIKKIKNIFGTCAGAILLSKNYFNLIEIEIERNAYGSQLDSFKKKIQTNLGEYLGVFIRAPKIKSIEENVKVIANDGEEIVGVEKNGIIALTFHPEFTDSKFHEYFLNKINK